MGYHIHQKGDAGDLPMLVVDVTPEKYSVSRTSAHLTVKEMQKGQSNTIQKLAINVEQMMENASMCMTLEFNGLTSELIPFAASVEDFTVAIHNIYQGGIHVHVAFKHEPLGGFFFKG